MVVTIATVALVVFAALIVTDSCASAATTGPRSRAPSSVRTADDAPASTTTTGPRNCRPLTASDPLRLWVGGDSLAGSLGPSLGTITGATGVVQPYFDSRVSSGLANPGFFDWPKQATAEMERLNPEIVVFYIGTNDFSAVSDGWKDDYAPVVDSMMKTLIGPGRTVYWVGAPTLKDDEKDRAVVEVNAVAQEVAKKHPEVHYVDDYKLFSDTDGGFAYDLARREREGRHHARGRRRAPHDRRRRLPRPPGVQARRRGVRRDRAAGGRRGQGDDQTEGSTQVAPSANSGGTSGGASSGSIATTPPATAPPTTSPPVTTPTEPPTSTHGAATDDDRHDVGAVIPTR